MAFLFFAVFHHGHFRGSDELGLMQVSRSLFDGGTLAVPRIRHTGEGADGRFYSHFSIGQPLLAIPFLGLGRLAEAILPESAIRAMAGPEIRIRVLLLGGSVDIFATGFYAPSVSALLVALFFLFQRELGVTRRSALLCALLFGTTTYVAMMSTFFLRHTSEVLAILGALFFFRRYREGGHTRDLWIGAALASLTFLVRLPAAVAAPGLAGYLVWCLWVRGGRRFDPEVLRAALLPVAAPLLVAVLISAAGDWVKWGLPWNIHQLRTASSQGARLSESLYAALFSPGMSVFVYSPLLLLAPFAFGTLWRAHRAEAVTFLVLAGTFLLVFSSFTGWTGLWSSPGPRYQLLSVPLFLLPLGLWLDAGRGRARWVVVAALGALGLFVQTVLMTVRWGSVIDAFGYKTAVPKWSFLFVPDQSPVVGFTRLFFRGDRFDLWLWTLARGWDGQDPSPGAALAIFCGWALAFAASIAWLVRGARRA